MAESVHNLERTTNASPVHPVQQAPQTRHAEARRAQNQQANEDLNQGGPFNVEDKVELQIEPEAVRQLQPNTHLKFVVSDDTDRIIVQIIQSDTNEVLREVPPKSLSEALATLNGNFAKRAR